MPVKNAREIFTLLAETMDLERGELYAQSIFVYLFSNSGFKPEEKKQLVLDMPTNLKRKAMNTLELTFYEGVEQGKLEGLEKGKLEGKLEDKLEGKLEGELLGIKKSIRQLLEHGYSPEQTADLLDVPVALVLDVQKELNEQN